MQDRMIDSAPLQITNSALQISNSGGCIKVSHHKAKKKPTKYPKPVIQNKKSNAKKY